MTTSLRNTIVELAQSFAQGVLDAIQRASLQDILAETGGTAVETRKGTRGPARKTTERSGGGRLGRRSVAQIEDLMGQIVTLLERNPDGMRAEDIREQLGVQAKELPRPLLEATQKGLVGKNGHKRATTYFAKKGRTARSAPKATRKAPAGRGKKDGAAKRPGRKARGRGDTGGAESSSAS